MDIRLKVLVLLVQFFVLVKRVSLVIIRKPNIMLKRTVIEYLESTLLII